MEKDHRLPGLDDGLQPFPVVPDFVLCGIEGHIGQLSVVNEKMFLAVGMGSEILRSHLVRLVCFARRWNERDILHSLEELLIRWGVPMLVPGVRLQILFVARLASDSK